MKYSNIPAAQSVVLFCKSRGIKDIVISPGSRNAPLTIGFSENAFFNCFSIVDERCAGFFALGMAQQQQKPVAIVCTSGSAVLNYYPAVAEAFYSDIPLVVISADRPPYKIDVGDGQTIRQEQVLKNHIGYEANLKLDVNHATDKIADFSPELLNATQENIQEFNQKEIDKALGIALETSAPVHINVPFEEPLYGKIQKPTVTIPEYQQEKQIDSNLEVDDCVAQWNLSERKMILTGTMRPNSLDIELLEKLGSDPSVLVFTETTSNLNHPNFFSSIDSIIFPIEKSKNPEALFKQLQPDLLVTLGGMVVSKKIKSFLRKYKPKNHWHIDSKKAYDTFFSSVQHIKYCPNTFLGQLLSKVCVTDQGYQQNWLHIKSSYDEKRTTYAGQIPFSDFWAYGKCIAAIPANYQVHFANSSSIRYAQLFDMNDANKVYCNRGTSGIEGSASTAIGAAFYQDSPTLLVTGDLSFFYDSNALWNNHIKEDFRIIIINNGGGGIFRILPGKEDSMNFQSYFETRHPYNAKLLADMYGFEYQAVEDKADLLTALGSFFVTQNGPRILEIFTPTDKNDEILLGYFDFIS